MCYNVFAEELDKAITVIAFFESEEYRVKRLMMCCLFVLCLFSGCGHKQGSALQVCRIENNAITTEATFKGKNDDVLYVELKTIHESYTEDEIDDNQLELIKSLFMKQHGILDEEYLETEVDKKAHKVIITITINMQENGSAKFLQTFGFGDGVSTSMKEIAEGSQAEGASCK